MTLYACVSTTASSLTRRQNVAGIDWDGTRLWIAENDFPNHATLSAVDVAGQTLGTFLSPVFEVVALAWADETLWSLGRDTQGGPLTVYRLRLESPLPTPVTPQPAAR